MEMRHEVRCIHFPCTCVEILRQKVACLSNELDATEKFLEEVKASTKSRIDSLEKKIQEGLSCCCAKCSRHNASLLDGRKYPEVGDIFNTVGFQLMIVQSDLANKEGRFKYVEKD
jgi:hypothetical protein